MKLVNCIACGVLVAALLIFRPPVAHAQKTYVVPGIVNPADERSKELEALTAAQANQVARRDLLSNLQPTGTFRPDPYSPVSGNVWGMTFVTWPYPTRYQSLCREDAVTLHYALVSHHDERRDRWYSKREPQGIDTQELFHADKLPIESAGMIATCDARHHGPKAKWFASPSELDAVQAANMFYTAEAQVRAGKLTPEPCGRVGQGACREWIISLDDVSNVASVKLCDIRADDFCYVISVGGDEITIRAKEADSPSKPAEITSIRVDAVTYITE